MKIYLCAGSHEIALAKETMQKLRAMGHTITHDWAAAIEKVGCANPRDVAEEQRRAWAYEDLAAIERADVFWMLIPKTPSFGASYEFGYAVTVSRACRVIVSGDWKVSIFTSLALHRFATHDEALAWIKDNDWRSVAKKLGDYGVR